MAKYIDADLAPFYLNKEGCEMINRIPTENVQEVKHGKWVSTQEEHICGDFIPTLQCSVCGNYEFYGKAIGTKFNYCPNCGEKMDKE